MDIGSHILSGAIVAAALPTTTVEQKIAVVIGATLPDLIFTPYIFGICKQAKKKLIKMTEHDFVTYGYSTYSIRIMKKIYFSCMAYRLSF